MSRRFLTMLILVVLVIGVLPVASAGAKPPADKFACTKIQSGILQYSSGHYLEGQPLTTGFDDYGYNYQAHMFFGSYANAYLGGAGFPPYTGDDASYLAENPTAASHWSWPYREVRLEIKWNSAWLSNVDCDHDGKLDRHHGFGAYLGSGAWETNHMWGDGWTYFTKISAAPSDATNVGGTWYSDDGVEIGPAIWGEFATTLEVESGTGVLYLSPFGPGFGHI